MVPPLSFVGRKNWRVLSLIGWQESSGRAAWFLSHPFHGALLNVLFWWTFIGIFVGVLWWLKLAEWTFGEKKEGKDK